MNTMNMNQRARGLTLLEDEVRVPTVPGDGSGRIQAKWSPLTLAMTERVRLCARLSAGSW